jgi:hypothetical protein
LIRRSAERLRHAGRERQGEHVPDADDVEENERGQDERAGQLDGLGADQQVAAIVAVGDHAADQRQQQDRQFADEAVEAEVEGRTADGQHQPVLRDLLHPGAGRRQDVGGPQQPEVLRRERRSEARQPARRRRDCFFWWRRGGLGRPRLCCLSLGRAIGGAIGCGSRGGDRR